MAYKINHNYDTETFEEWADELDVIVAWAEIEYDEDDEEVDEEWLDWSVAGACATEEIAKLVEKDSEDEYTKTDICSPSAIDFSYFLGNIREDSCFAVLNDGEPVAIVFAATTAQKIAKHVEENGGKPTIECTYEYRN